MKVEPWQKFTERIKVREEFDKELQHIKDNQISTLLGKNILDGRRKIFVFKSPNPTEDQIERVTYKPAVDGLGT